MKRQSKFTVALLAALGALALIVGIAHASIIDGITDHSVTIDQLACGTHYSITLTPDGGPTETQSATTLACPDTTPPVASISSPAQGASVSGTITVSASATDPTPPPPTQDVSGVATVQLVVDGQNFGSPIAAPGPYSASLDTTTLLNGDHTLSAFAVDKAGNVGQDSAPVTIHVSNNGSLPNISLPIRGTFMYPWYPETWYSDQHYHPVGGNYDSGAIATIDRQLDQMAYANIGLSIDSWWGQGTPTDNRISTILNETTAHGSNVKHALYYEQEGYSNPSVAQIQSDLQYINSKYGTQPAYARINGKPVVFVYAQGSDGCSGPTDMVERWHDANTGLGSPDYIVLKVFSNYSACPDQPDNWHQYAPANRSGQHGTHSFYVSPGYWLHSESTPRLARDPQAFQTAVAAMQAAHVDFKLVQTWNEWGEGTEVEAATEYGTCYLDILHANGAGPLPSSCGTPPNPVLTVTKSGAGSGTVTSSPAGIDCGSTCAAAYVPATVVTLTEVPASGSTFSGWSGACSGAGTTCTVTMDTAQTVNAAFATTPPNQFPLNVTKSGAGVGTVTSSPTGINCGSVCSANFGSGTAVTLTEVPGAGSTFVGWSGDCSGSSTTCAVTMSQARNVTATFSAVSSGSPCGTMIGPSQVTKVIWILMENTNYSSVYPAQPYETQIANQCGLATNYDAISHPSLPNYVALTTGSTQGITDDSNPSAHPLDVDNIYHQALTIDGSARQYSESMSGNCQLTGSGPYYVRHAPWAYFINGVFDQQRTQCQANDVPMGTYQSGNFHNDVVNGTLPSFSFVTPNGTDDDHDSNPATGDAYLSNLVPFITSGPDYQAGHVAIFITFDENGSGSPNHVYTSVISPYTTPGTQSATAYTHYSLLRTTEEILGLPLLGGAQSANSMLAAFNLG